MRLVTYQPPGADAPMVGELVDGAVRQLRAASMVEWICGSGRAAAGPEHDPETVRLLAPVPQPPSYRDFLTYEGHFERAFRNLSGDPTVMVPDYWYEKPAFYFGNHHAILGPGEKVLRPLECQWLDYELELAGIADGDGGIAGFTLLNDWSARDIQRREGTVGLGVHKSKDFGTSLGPWLVTPDELPYEDGRVNVKARVEVNGEIRTETDSSQQHFRWPEIFAAAARGTVLKAGDVLGSGTLDWGCNAEMGSLEDQRWIVPGDVVSLIADRLGELWTPVEQFSDT
jgi:fumarylacetoacetate (FAA) hydrolase